MKNPFDSLNPSEWETMNDVAERLTIAGAMGFLEDEDEKNNVDIDGDDEDNIEDDSSIYENE